MDVTLHLAQDPEADALLGRSPLAALVGMLLDQQVPMEWAFKGPATIAQRLGTDDLDAHEIAAHEPEAFAALLSQKPPAPLPAIHGQADPAAVPVPRRALRR
ncbi:hypothetical protein SPURM210S_00889 [Streptomyces purpurascens]